MDWASEGLFFIELGPSVVLILREEAILANRLK
jgi:hypothetical protein